MTSQEAPNDETPTASVASEDILPLAELARLLSNELSLSSGPITRTIALLDEGNTIPFIARYRKEMTGELNELQIRHIQERARQLRQLQSRREEIARLIEEWTGIEVEYTAGTSYNAVIEAARANRVDCYTVGPFAYILGVEEADAEALAIANDSLYGLGAGVWTRDINRAYRFGRNIQAGRVWTNCYHLYPAHAAFGGYKQSGIGRETHKMMLSHYQQVKNLLVSYSPNALGFF